MPTTHAETIDADLLAFIRSWPARRPSVGAAGCFRAGRAVLWGQGWLWSSPGRAGGREASASQRSPGGDAEFREAQVLD